MMNKPFLKTTALLFALLFASTAALFAEEAEKSDKLENDVVTSKFRGIELDSPLVVSNLGHLEAALSAPVAQGRTFATQHQTLISSELRSTHVDNRSLSETCACEFALGALGKAVGECTTIEVAVLWQVKPMIIDGVALGLST